MRERRARLLDVIADAALLFPARRLARNGLKAWAQVLQRGYAGLVAKDESSPYEGGPTLRWLKVKQAGWVDREDGWKRRISEGDSVSV